MTGSNSVVLPAVYSKMILLLSAIATVVVPAAVDSNAVVG